MFRKALALTGVGILVGVSVMGTTVYGAQNSDEKTTIRMLHYWGDTDADVSSRYFKEILEKEFPKAFPDVELVQDTCDNETYKNKIKILMASDEQPDIMFSYGGSFMKSSVFCGHDELSLSASAVGVQAGIGSTFNFMAEKFVKIQKLLAENNWAEAAIIQDETNAVIEELCKIGVFKGVKAALKLQGMDCGECRKPFQPLRDDQIAELEKILRENHCL